MVMLDAGCCIDGGDAVHVDMRIPQPLQADYSNSLGGESANCFVGSIHNAPSHATLLWLE
jgi:hypothetical protein